MQEANVLRNVSERNKSTTTAAAKRNYRKAEHCLTKRNCDYKPGKFHDVNKTLK